MDVFCLVEGGDGEVVMRRIILMKRGVCVVAMR